MKTLVCCFVLLCGTALNARAEQGAGALFNRRCRACHTFGNGDLVGPDLKGVTDRHSRAWLTAWITSSQTLIRSGDPAANALFKKFRQIPMPDQSFAGGELASLLDYFAEGGPDAEAKRNRRADSATPAEIGLGRELFMGQRALSDGGAPCLSCHRIGDTLFGGSLGPELTHAYSKFQDRRLAALLSRGCFPRMPDISARKSLSGDESFALKAFLRKADTDFPVADHPRLSLSKSVHPIMRDELLFVVVPRLAALCCLSALVMTSLVRPRTGERALDRDDRFGVAVSRSWRYSIAVVLFGHVLAFAFPAAVMFWNRQLVRLIVLEFVGVTAGSVALLSLLLIPVRRLRRRRSSFDIVVATLIVLEVVSGLAVALRYRWASSWAEVTLTPYLHSLLGLKPSVLLVARMPFLVRLHVFCAFAILAIAPLTWTAGPVIASIPWRARRTAEGESGRV